MAIDVVWQDENGKELAHSPVPWEYRMARTASLSQYHCLQYVDPYGDATFNQLQLPQLVREMEQAISQLHSSDLRRRAEQVLDFVRGGLGLLRNVKSSGNGFRTHRGRI